MQQNSILEATGLCAPDDVNSAEQFAIDCYHGGRNKMFVFGPNQDRVLCDFDIAGAYTTSLLPK